MYCFGGTSVFKKNTKQVNRLMAKILIGFSAVVIAMVILSLLGVFEFGTVYTGIVLVAGLIITVSPTILIRFLSDNVMRYYMMLTVSVFVAILGMNNHIGINITYALAPIFSCLYFEPRFTVKISIFSYVMMLISVYMCSENYYEVVYQGRPRTEMFIAYALGYTIEYFVITAALIYLVRRSKKMMEERYSAEEANKMKTNFLSNMSHEIRTPMNAIIGMADVALRKEMDDDLRKNISVIKSSSTGLLEIINDILDLSKIEAGKLKIIEEPYSVKTLTEDMIAIVDARNVDKKIPIYYHIGDNMPSNLIGDAVRIKQVMFNYASNAIKYTNSGRIDISVDCQKADDDYVYLTYSVKDTGQGIKQEDIGKLFTMYSQLNVTANHGKEGTGIGLAISKYFIDHMNGTVHVESSYGKGSTFSFTIPQKIAAEQPESIAEKEMPNSFITRNARILLVDDNEINREVVVAILEPLKIEIHQAKDGLEAVNMAKETPYDLILMDSHMPVMNGEEATGCIRRMNGEVNQNTPIIALTADAIVGVKERLVSSGMNDYLVKPIDVKLLYSIIRKYLPEDKIVEQ